MKAKEMFEKLGYKDYHKMDNEIVFNYNWNEEPEEYRYISFNLITKKIELSDWRKDFYLNMKELQAINQQVKELGWNE